MLIFVFIIIFIIDIQVLSQELINQSTLLEQELELRRQLYFLDCEPRLELLQSVIRSMDFLLSSEFLVTLYPSLIGIILVRKYFFI